MSAESVLYAALKNSPAVTALVGASIHEDYAREGASLPCIVYRRGGTEYHTTIHTGVPHDESVTLQVFCLSADRLSVDGVADAVVSAVGAAGLYPVSRTAESPDAEDVALYATVIEVIHYT